VAAVKQFLQSKPANQPAPAAPVAKSKISSPAEAPAPRKKKIEIPAILLEGD